MTYATKKQKLTNRIKEWKQFVIDVRFFRQTSWGSESWKKCIEAAWKEYKSYKGKLYN